jgi:hypothetical protein
MLCWHKSPKWGRLKGKCAFGSFLSILVIECQLKCLKCEFMQWMNKVQITSKGMFLSLSTLVLCTNIFCLSVRNSEKKKRRMLAVYSQQAVSSWGTGLSGVHRTVSGAPDQRGANQPLSGFLRRLRLKFTGLSGVHRTVR